MHGCEGCRDAPNQQELIQLVLASGAESRLARCPECGAWWRVKVSPGSLAGELLHVRVEPATGPPAN